MLGRDCFLTTQPSESNPANATGPRQAATGGGEESQSRGPGQSASNWMHERNSLLHVARVPYPTSLITPESRRRYLVRYHNFKKSA